MNPRIKRLLSMLLALTMMFSFVVPVAAASTTGNTVEIEVGESVKLGSSGWFTKTTWTSSDETVATVSGNGTVTGVAVGTATITATSKSIFGFFGGTTTTAYTVVVTEAAPEVPTEPEAGLTVEAGQTLQLTVDANGGTTTWSSSDETVATVDENGLVTGVSEGEVTITATVTKTTGNGFWFFWWGSKTTTTKTEFAVTVLPGEPEVTFYTVTFETNGGSAVEAQTVAEGDSAVEPEAPAMEGYTFAGWYADAELTEAYDFAAPVTADITLYAAWEEVIVYYTVTFETNGGSAVEAQAVAEGDSAVEPEAPAMEGYTFTGWYADEELTEAYDFAAPVTADITLYAAWEEVIVYYTVTFETNGGSAVEAQTVAEGDSAVEPEAPAMEGYTFTGWYADEELTEAYDFAAPVTADITLYAAWEVAEVEPDDAVDEEDTTITEDDTFVLTASEDEIPANTATPVTFYVNTTLTVPYFELYLDGTNTSVALYDDGDYSVSGDDIPNDGCYTGTYTIDMDYEGDIVFVAQAAVGDDVACTNEVSIYLYYELTDEQLELMISVEGTLAALIEEARNEVGEDAEESVLVEAIRQKTDAYLQQLQADGVIHDLDYAEGSYMYSWVYTESGVEAGYIIYEPEVTEGDGWKGNILRAEEENITLNSLVVDTTYSKGSVVILNNYEASNSWNIAYDACADMLTDAGFDVTSIYAFTVADFKDLADYNSMILVNSHGNTHNGKESGRPCICTDEDASDNRYSSDLKKKRIMRVNGKYWIAPKFFEYYYDDEPLSDPIVYLGICRGYANDKLVSVLEEAGAGAVLGYSASVSVAYDNAMIKTLTERLIAGDRVDDALSYAKKQHGSQDPSKDGDWNKHAVLNIYGYQGEMLYRQLKNGNFDDALSLGGNLINGWKRYGDSRSILKLSGISPISAPRMAIISSGFGSKNDETTSSIFQTFLVPENAQTLTFSYDVVSEEPMEWVGSSFDDIFQVDILSTDGQILETLAYESVNASTWYAVDGINFPGGDDTTYHTRWQTVTTDAISKYCEQLIVLRFTVQDTGDAIYDTAALIDSVSISTAKTPDAGLDLTQTAVVDEETYKNEDEYDAFLSAMEKDTLTPGLDEDYVPQGIAVSESTGLTYVSAYYNKRNSDTKLASVVAVLDTNGNLVAEYHLNNADGTAMTGHVGGVAVTDSTLFVSWEKDSTGYRIAAFPLSDLNSSGCQNVNLTTSYVVPVSPSMMSYHDGYLWIGNFYDPEIDGDKDGELDFGLCPEMNYTTEGYGCYIMGYNLSSEGNDRLLPDSGYDYAAPDVVMAAPERVQGMVYSVDSDTVVLSRSWTRKVSGTADLKYYSVDLAASGDTTLTINDEEVSCYVLNDDRLDKTLRSIPMNEGIALDNEEKLLIVYESGASYYKDDPSNPADHPTDYIWRSKNAL